MARKFLTAIDLTKLELQNAAMHNLAAAPASPVKGQVYLNTTDNILYWWDGSAWQSAKAGSGFPGYGSVPAETTFGIAKSDGVATTVARSDHTHGSPTHDNAAHSAVNLSALAAPTADVSMGNFKIVNLAAPSAATDGANKGYVDSTVAGLSWKQAVRCATTGNIALSGLQTIDNITLTANQRVLVKQQTTTTENGLYNANSGAWTRTADADVGTELESAAVFVEAGTVNGDTAWIQVSNAPLTIGSSAIQWTQFSGAAAYQWGNGLSNTGNLIFVTAANGSIVVGADDIQVGYAGSGGTNGTAVTAARSDHTHTGFARTFTLATHAAATSVTVNHALNTRNVLVNVFRTATPWDTVDTDVERTDANNVTVRFAVAPAANEYTFVVVG